MVLRGSICPAQFVILHTHILTVYRLLQRLSRTRDLIIPTRHTSVSIIFFHVQETVSLVRQPLVDPCRVINRLCLPVYCYHPLYI